MHSQHDRSTHKVHMHSGRQLPFLSRSKNNEIVILHSYTIYDQLLTRTNSLCFHIWCLNSNCVEMFSVRQSSRCVSSLILALYMCVPCTASSLGFGVMGRPQIHVHPTRGSDGLNESGTVKHPFRTIERARVAMRIILEKQRAEVSVANTNSSRAGGVIVLHGGTF